MGAFKALPLCGCSLRSFLWVMSILFGFQSFSAGLCPGVADSQSLSFDTLCTVEKCVVSIRCLTSRSRLQTCPQVLTVSALSLKLWFTCTLVLKSSELGVWNLWLPAFISCFLCCSCLPFSRSLPLLSPRKQQAEEKLTQVLLAVAVTGCLDETSFWISVDLALYTVFILP